MGIKGETFTSPEAVLVYSSEGIGQMTRTFHDLYRKHLIRGEYKDKKRPILINNWKHPILTLIARNYLVLLEKPRSLELKCWLSMMAGLE